MADEFQRSKLYEYGANSNLVLEADREVRRRNDEATGEVETLHGKLGVIRMGDRLDREKHEDLSSRIKKAQTKRQIEETTTEIRDKSKKRKKDLINSNVLQETEILDSINYRPKTRESRSAYEEILNFIQICLGDQPQDILLGAAEEVLSLLKDQKLKDPERHREIEKIISKISPEKFNKLVNLGKKITDFSLSGEINNDQNDSKLDEDVGVAVVFEDDDDNEINEDLSEVHDSDEDDELGVEAMDGKQLKGGDDNINDDNDIEINQNNNLSVHNIDAHWLQRQLSKYYSDANLSAKLADDTLNTLQIIDGRECENQLVALLDYDKFDFIKLLLNNRWKIYYCTKLKQAQNDNERLDIELEMKNDSKGFGKLILDELKQTGTAESWAADRLGEFANKVRREARALNKSGKDEKISDEIEENIGGINGSGISYNTNNTNTNNNNNEHHLLDLDSLQFVQGGHLMANTRCELPEKSWRAQKKGYEEVHVPALRPIISSKEKLVQISSLPEWCQPAFGNVKSLNRIQSRMVESAMNESNNILLCAPTGAGKTIVALMCMLNIINRYLRSDGTIDLDSFKIVYIAPMKALVQEVVQNFSIKLAPFGINVKELSGDQNLTRQQIQETQLIVTTPEKWDIITRKAGDRAYTQLVRLIIIDEIHLLHDDRGPVLEALVARTIRQIEVTHDMVRLVGLSATLPNFEDVATFLRVDPEKGLFFFDNSFRPVPLQQQYIGITEKKALKRFQLMNEICYEKVLQHAGRNQILIFTHSRAETAKTAKALRDMALENDVLSQFVRDDSASKEILREESNSVKNSDLKDLLPYGFAIHHAGMVRSDRTLVEDLFSDKHVQVLVSTATLAWGVNLPAHTVILKGTQMYSPEQGRWVELSPLDIMQMMGRAGRYGLDSEGEGIIITSHSELQYYLSLMNQQLPIESQFIKKLPDMLNAEIVLGSIQSIKEAAIWLSYTYLFIRMLRNPTIYGISKDEIKLDPTLMQRRIDLVHSAAVTLDKHNLIRYDRKTGMFQITALGRVASHYYVSHESINIFNEYLKPTLSEIEIFRLFSLSGEFKFIHVREEEKLELIKLLTRVPIPIKEGVDEPSAKINVLLQAYISRLKLEGFALVADMTYIQQSASRLMRCLFEVSLKRGWASLASKTLALCKMIEKRSWGSQSPLRQFTGIPELIIRKLEKNSDITWDRYYDLKPLDLGEMVKIPKMGKTLHKYVHMFPKLELSAHFQPVTRSLLMIDLTITPDFQFDTQVHDFAQLFWVIVEDVNCEKILHYEAFILRKQYSTEPHLMSFSVTLTDPLPPQYFIRVVSDRWLHSETILPISFKNIILPSKFPPTTELLDLQPLPISALRNKQYESLYKYNNLKYFNPIQTQTFAALYESDDNCLVCAPTGSGKTICAEFSILRLFNNQSSKDNNIFQRCVYITSKQETCDIIYDDWSVKFASLGISIVKLKGDITTDLNLIEKGNLIITTAIQWDMLSRRWKQRKVIQNINLYIFDEIHLIGSSDGVTLEIVASRARYISSQLGTKVRVVLFGASIANAKDVAEWMGVSIHSFYNFSPSVRPIPLELHLHGFESNHFGLRLLSMAKPVYSAIIGYSSNKPAIIFVPSRKQCHLTAIDIMTYAAASGQPNRFLHLNNNNNSNTDNSNNNNNNELFDSIKDVSLLQTINHGIGFIHNGLSKNDKKRVLNFYRDGIIQVLICPFDLCWSISIPAHLVVIMETTYYDGKEHRFLNYSITDLMQMIGFANRPLIDDIGKAVILCHAPKKDYIKRLVNEPLPVESHLDHFLHDHLTAEIVTKTIENKQDAVDYLTWTFYYRRLTQNPNYYNLQGVTHRHLSDHLSELIENTILDLEESKCISVEDDIELSPLNLGMIASYYYIQYTTIELYASSITAKTKLKGLMEILSSSSEYSQIIMRQSEELVLSKLANHLPQSLPNNAKFDDPAIKTLLLLQSHFCRRSLSTDLNIDLNFILSKAIKLIQALVDVISSQSWLRPALACMELSQIIVQGQWDKDSVLLQIPHFNEEIIQRCSSHKPPVETVFDIIDLEPEDRDQLLNLSPEKMSDVALFCNSYPNIELSYQSSFEGAEVESGDTISVIVVLQREISDEDVDPNLIGKVVSPRFPEEKIEGWWVVIGDTNTNSLLSIKRLNIGVQNKIKLEFNAPEDPGDYTLTLYLMSDSYLGCDQEYELSLTVIPADNDSNNDDMEG